MTDVRMNCSVVNDWTFVFVYDDDDRTIDPENVTKAPTRSIPYKVTR